jgi:hypothetical protein
MDKLYTHPELLSFVDEVLDVQKIKDKDRIFLKSVKDKRTFSRSEKIRIVTLKKKYIG